MGLVYDDLKRRVATSPVVNTDDTGWRINATLAFVMGFLGVVSFSLTLGESPRRNTVPSPRFRSAP